MQENSLDQSMKKLTGDSLKWLEEPKKDSTSQESSFQDQRSEAWYKFRSTHIGASEIGAIMGKSPYRTRYQIWREKVLGEKQEDNFVMRMGREAEPKIKELYELRTGHVLTSLVSEWKEWPVLSASLDGLIPGDRVVEFKRHGKKGHTGPIPEHDMLQMQQQMLIAEVDTADYVNFDGQEISIREVKADKELQELILAAAKEFWQLVESNTPPPADVIEVENEEMLAKIERIQYLAESIKALEADKKELTKQVEKWLPHQKIAISKYQVTLVERSSNINYKAIPELQGVDLDKYRGAPNFYIKISERKMKGET